MVGKHGIKAVLTDCNSANENVLILINEEDETRKRVNRRGTAVVNGVSRQSVHANETCIHNKENNLEN